MRISSGASQGIVQSHQHGFSRYVGAGHLCCVAREQATCNEFAPGFVCVWGRYDGISRRGWRVGFHGAVLDCAFQPIDLPLAQKS